MTFNEKIKEKYGKKIYCVKKLLILKSQIFLTVPA